MPVLTVSGVDFVGIDPLVAHTTTSWRLPLMPRSRHRWVDPSIVRDMAADTVFSVTRVRRNGEVKYLVVTNVSMYLALRELELLRDRKLLVRVIPRSAIPTVVMRGIYREYVAMRALYPRCARGRAAELVERMVAVKPELQEAGVHAVTGKTIACAIDCRMTAPEGRV